MSNDTTRATFEAWASREGWLESEITDKIDRADSVKRGEYRHAGLQDLWELWEAATRAALAAPAPQPNALLEWAVARWRDEVQHRPLVNKNRRSLDDAWRQVIRYAGGDPVELIGPSHDELVSAPAPQRPMPIEYLIRARWPDGIETYLNVRGAYDLGGGRLGIDVDAPDGHPLADDPEARAAISQAPSVTDAVSPTLMKRYALSPDNGFMYEASRGPWVRFVDVPTPEGKQP